MAVVAAQVELNRAPTRGLRWGRLLLAGLLLLAALSGPAVAWRWLSVPDRFPLKAVRLDGRLANVEEAELRQAVLPHLNRGMLGLDVARIRQAVEALPWVAEASVRRRWPDTLVIGAVEHVAVARWNASLISDRGVVFAPEPATLPAGLPVLQGPSGSADKVWARYRRLEEIFGRAELQIVRLRLDERRAWSAALADGVVVQLGVGDSDAAAERFARALPRIDGPADARLARVDLRYPNGFALAWSRPAAPPSPGKN